MGELPSSLMHALELTREKRLKQAQDWATGLVLVGKRSQPKQRQLEIHSRGSQWLSGSLKEQYGQIYDFLRPLPSDKRIYDTGISFLSSIDSLSSYENDYRFLGANVTAIKTRPDQPARYWEAKSKDHEALRDSIHRSFTALPPGVFHRLENVLDHLVFEQYNPLLLGQAQERILVFEHGKPVPALVDLENRQPGRYSRILFASD